MNCKYCRSWNAEDEHRCTRCGRRLSAALAGAQHYPASRSAPALALDEQPRAIVEEAALLPPRAPVPLKLSFADDADFPNEPAASKVIPFESFAAHRIQDVAYTPAAARAAHSISIGSPVTGQKPAGVKPAARRRAPATPKDERQAGLDFFVPPPQGPRTLKTQVEAVIFCDAEVAPPKHRVIAAAIDGGMIFVAFAVFLFAFHFLGGLFRFNRQTIPFFIGVFGALATFYGLVWIWAGRETAGMRWTGLRLIDFDGFPANRRTRLLRALGASLSFCAGGIGLLWALADEEKLTWHDHMSKTFPTYQESNSSFFRKG